MPVIKRIRNRNVTITVEAHAEVMFMPGGQVNRWSQRFVNHLRNETIKAAPTNKRPRWSHYGDPLKKTITATRPQFRQWRASSPRIYAAVGSSAPYAYYVDQGTGVYAGGSAYEAKILPPYERNSPTLYEKTWRPRPDSGPIKKAWIKGQRGQEFFAEGLRDAYRRMQVPSAAVPDVGEIGDARNFTATGLAGFAGNTPSDAAFQSQLEEWRSWRDKAWGERTVLGQGHVRERERREFADIKKTITTADRREQQAAERRRRGRERTRRWRERKAEEQQSKGTQKTQQSKVNQAARRKDKAAFINHLVKKYGSVERETVEYRNGYWYGTVPVTNDRGRTEFREVRSKAKT